jgi:hypothetical protein
VEIEACKAAIPDPRCGGAWNLAHDTANALVGTLEIQLSLSARWRLPAIPLQELGTIRITTQASIGMIIGEKRNLNNYDT